jgi:hypothetical protein
MHSITAAYSCDSNFKQVTSNAVSETIEGFTLSVVGRGSATASKGGQPAYTFSVVACDKEPEFAVTVRV